MALGLRSPLLERHGFRHAFFMRRGGVSEPPYASLNFSTYSATGAGDREENVAANLASAAADLGVAASHVYYLSQVHGIDSHVVDGHQDRAEVARLRGDITLASTPDVACGVRMADCAAILLGHASGAVAAVHSGWRGTVVGAAAAGVRALAALAGGDGRDMVAAVGPHIEACCFEVGEDVAAEIAAAAPQGDDVVDRRRARPHVDLRRMIAAQLRAEGVEQIDHVAGCTVCDGERFHSYRRDGPDSGRMLAAVVSRGRVPR